MRITKKKLSVVIAATAVVALGAGAAQAYFSSTGEGQDTATVGTTSPFTVTFGALTGGPMFPGDASTDQTRPYSISYAGPGTSYLSSVTASIVADGAGNVLKPDNTSAGGCLAEWFTATPSGEPAGPVGPGNSNDGVVTIHMIDTGTDQNACQGVSVQVKLTAN